MDGLSAAASGIAVVSLAIQLVDSVREIRRFFRTLKDAPDELDRLLDLLELMELMLGNIGKLVDPDSDISSNVLKAMQTCEKALGKLGALVQKSKRNLSAQSPLKRRLGFFKIACEKQEVEEIEKQLDRAVNILNMAMTALNSHGIQQVWSGVSATNAATATITEVVLRMEVASNQKGSKQKFAGNNWSRRSRSAVCRRSATYKEVYRGFLGSITARIQSQSEELDDGEHSKESYARDEWSLIFIPSFFSRCVQVQCVSSFGSVERTLRTCPILPDDHPAWDMCYAGDVTSIQKLFSTREISPYAIDRFGETLLHTATGSYCAEICDLLIKLGVGVDVVDAHGYPAKGWTVLDDTCDEIESIYRLFAAASDDRDLVNFCPEYFKSLQNHSVEDFRSRVEKWVTEENVNLFDPNPLGVVTRRLCNLSIDPSEFHKWKDIALYLISKEAELSNEETCLLEVAVTSVAHPFDAQKIGTRFLEMLGASNVDLAEYLNFERQHHPKGLLLPEALISTYGTQWTSPWNSDFLWLNWPDPREAKLYIHEEQPFSLSWDWWVDPQATAFIVCHEFRHFGRAEHFVYGEDEQILSVESRFWPFIYPKWTIGPSYWAREEDKELLKRVEQRSDRRWQKKMIKEAKIQGAYKKPKMPGTWID